MTATYGEIDSCCWLAGIEDKVKLALFKLAMVANSDMFGLTLVSTRHHEISEY